jgi:filamentous hemagglutinin family protein
MNHRPQIHLTSFCAAILCCAGLAGPLRANPSGLTVVSGSATQKTTGSQLTITVSPYAVLNWSSFNIMSGETTSFLQPSANSIVLDNIGGASPSKIWGTLTANGTVILANASGFYFGPNSMVKVGGDFIATTTPLPPDYGIGSSWIFTGMPPLASIVNYGQIAAGSGHGLYLIAEQINNQGSLSAPGGQVGLYAGQSVLLSERPDGRGVSASVQIPAGSVDNNGKITANAGEIALDAQVVNQNGIIQADSVQSQNGVISLVASDQLNLGPSSQILARGDDSLGGSSGGSVTLRSGNTFSDSLGSQITTTGGAQGGNGGNVEISAPNVLSLNSA